MQNKTFNMHFPSTFSLIISVIWYQVIKKG